MITNEVDCNEATRDASVATVDMKLEAVVIPVADVDRAKEFYRGLGWRTLSGQEMVPASQTPTEGTNGARVKEQRPQCPLARFHTGAGLRS